MSEEIVFRGIVLRNTPYGESDGIVSCLTEQGIVTFKARGILKLTSRHAAACLLYAFSEFTLEEKKQRRYLVKSQLIESNYRLYESLESMCCLGLVAEAVLTFLDAGTSVEIFRSFRKLLEGMNQGFDLLTLSAICLAKITVEAGYGPEVNACIRCGGKTKIVSFRPDEGGFICAGCLKGGEPAETPGYLKSARYIFNVPKERYLSHALDREISVRLIRELILNLQNQFGYRKLGFFDLFSQTFA